ncbi:uncharacterized protein [Centroberyx affinis]|uniref:uncharacterized protein n=1 Tax=Centroberyx affinis TaxID=166261 RepID=UPI003A5C3939
MKEGEEPDLYLDRVNKVVQCILQYGGAVWFSDLSVQLKARILRLLRICSKVVGHPVEDSFLHSCSKRTLRLADRVAQDSSDVLNEEHQLLASGKRFRDFSLNIDGSIVTPSTHVRNLGIILDPTLSFLPHVNQITKAAFFHLRNIARLRPSLSFSAAETLIHAFITSRLDYYNSILYGSSNNVLNKLQYVQNSAARLLTSTRCTDHITPVLHDLHWLPIKYRIHFKILLTTFKAINNLAPPYLADLLHHHTPTRHLRSADANLLQIIRTKHRTWGDRAFAAAAPSLWNALPSHIRKANTLSSFKKALKTHLFTLAFDL